MENLIILGSIILLLTISFFIGIKSKQSSSAAGFIGSSKSFSSIVVALSGTAAIASGWMLVGLPGVVYTDGNSMTMNGLMAGAFSISYIFLGKKVRAIAEVKDVATIGDLVDARYNNDNKIKFMTSLVVFLGCFAYLASQIAAGASLLTFLFGWDVFPSAVLIFGVVIIYVAVGGESAGILSQAFQGAIMVIAGVIVISIFFFNRGFGAMTQGVINNPVVTGSNAVVTEFKSIQLTAFGTATQAQSLTWFTLAWLGTVCQPAVITRMFALRNPRDLPKLGLQTGLTQAIVSFFGFTIGYLALLLVSTGKMNPIAFPSQITWEIGKYLGFGMQLVLYTAVMAAVISSASTYLTVAAASISKDVISCLGYKFNDKEQIFVYRLSIVIVGILSIILASFSGQTIALLGALGWATFVSILLPVVVIGMLWEKANTKGMRVAAFTSLIGNIIGMFVVGFADISWPQGLPWYMYLIALSTTLGILISYFTYDESKDKINRNVIVAMRL